MRKRAKNGGKLRVPVLFLHGAYDTTCETMTRGLPSRCAATAPTSPRSW